MAHQSVRSKADRARSSATSADAREIPDKLYFRIGEVARLCGVAPYVLRFWESEFSQLKPNKGGTGQRLYRRRDVEMALRVKTLLHDQGYTIAGARQHLKSELRAKGPQPIALTPVSDPPSAAGATSADAGPDKQPKLQQLRAEMQSLLNLLSQQPVRSAQPTPKSAKTVQVQSIRSAKPRPATRPEFASLFDNLE